LLRISQAPHVQDIQTLLNSGPGAEFRIPNKESRIPTGTDKQAAPAPKLTESVSSPPPPQPKKALENIHLEDWVSFVHKTKAKDAFFGAQIENLLFLGCENFKIRLQPPQNFAFLGTQLQNAEMRQKLQGFIDSELAQGYTFEVLKSTALATGDTASTLATKKLVQAEEQMMEKWKTDPRVLKAKEVFKGEIKLIKKSE
ncbi:MAG: DNA polymerase III subunit gamma/tau, partial [Pseudobdellovibrio sp.]